MTMLAQLLRTFRRLGVVATAGILASGALVAAAPGASAAGATVAYCSTTDLQTAIDDATPGTTLAVYGTCAGNYTIDKNLTLLGHGNAVLDGQDSGTTLTVSAGATVGVAHLTVTDGNASGTAGSGGAINNSGTLTLDQSAVTNSAAGSYGGGIYNNFDGTLTLNQTAVTGNSSSVFGGGIYNENAMTIKDTIVRENSAQLAGGGIFTGFGFAPVTLTGSNINGNTATAGSGGGIFNILDSATLQNSTVSGNTAALVGGGINNNAGTTTLNDSIVTHNTAVSGESGSFGGGIFTFSGTVPLNNSTVSGNLPDNCDPPGNVTGCTG
jgi:nitrous oxidase accessory protein NosD